MLSIYPGVSQIYAPRRSVHLRYTCIPVHPPSLLNDILGGRDWSSLERHLEAEMEWTHRCTWRPWSSEFGDALGDRDWVNSQMHWEAVIEQVWTCTWRPSSSELRDALWGCDWASSEMHLQAMIEQDWRSTWRRSIWREARRQLRLYSLVKLYLDQKLAGSRKLSILGCCCAWCMLYLVLAHDHGMER